MSRQGKQSGLRGYQVNGQSREASNSPSNRPINGCSGGETTEPPAYESKDEDRITQTMENVNLSEKDIIIAVMGVTGAGKSTFISLLSDEEIEIGHGMESCTSKVGVFQFPYKGSRVFLIDTPGFDDTNRSDSEVLKDVAFWLAAAYSKSVRLAGIIYLHRIIDPRMQGTALKNLRMFQKLCGDGNLGSVVLATTHWHNDEGGPAVTEKQGQERIKELIDRKDFWGGMVKLGSHVLKHDGSKASALNIVSMLVDQKIKVILDIQRQMVEEHKNLDDTDAGQALRGELIAERKRFERKLKDLEADLTDAMHANDEAWRQEILKEKKEFQAQIEKSDREREALQIDLKKIAEEKEAQYQELLNKMADQEKAHQAERDDQTRRMNEFQEQQRQRSEKEAKEKKELDAKYLKLEAQRRDDDARFRDELLRTHSENEKRMLEAQHRIAEEKHEAEQGIQKERERANRERWEAAEARAQQDAEVLRRENTGLAERQAYLERESKKRSRLNPKRWFGEKYRD